MSKTLEYILMPVEDILSVLERTDYVLAGELRASFTKSRISILRISPSSQTEFWWREVSKPNGDTHND